MRAANSISARREAPSSVADSIRRGALRCGGWVGGEVLGLCGGTVFGISLAGWRCWRLTCPRLDRIWGLMKRLVLLTLERVYVNTAITAMFILKDGRSVGYKKSSLSRRCTRQRKQTDNSLGQTCAYPVSGFLLWHALLIPPVPALGRLQPVPAAETRRGDTIQCPMQTAHSYHACIVSRGHGTFLQTALPVLAVSGTCTSVSLRIGTNGIGTLVVSTSVLGGAKAPYPPIFFPHHKSSMLILTE